MRVCLVNPPIIQPKSPGVIPNPFQPLGLAYIAAVLEENHKVSIIDAPGKGWRNLLSIDRERYYLGLSFEEIFRQVKSFSPDVVGITIPFSFNSRSAFKVASIVKSIDKEIPTILGGPHPSIRPLETLSRPDVDFVVIGEGERTFPELLQKLEQPRANALKDIAGIAYLESGKPTVNPYRPLVNDLDTLPFPARHLLPMEEYFLASQADRLYRGGALEKGVRWASMITSRGCPYQCVFCSIHIVMGRQWRARSPENVVEEIEDLVSTYEIRHITFEDDNMTLDKNRARRICDLIVEHHLDIEWSMPNGVRADTLDRTLIERMKDSGCRWVFVAPESGDQRIVNQIIKKKIDLKKVEEAVSFLVKVRITVDAAFVIGFIGETKEDILKTIHYAEKLKKLGVARCNVAIAIPLYGTELYEQARKAGYLRKDLTDEDLMSTEPLIETPEFTAEELRKLRDLFNKTVNPFLSLSNISTALRRPARATRYLLELIEQRIKRS